MNRIEEVVRPFVEEADALSELYRKELEREFESYGIKTKHIAPLSGRMLSQLEFSRNSDLEGAGELKNSYYVLGFPERAVIFPFRKLIVHRLVGGSSANPSTNIIKYLEEISKRRGYTLEYFGNDENNQEIDSHYPSCVVKKILSGNLPRVSKTKDL